VDLASCGGTWLLNSFQQSVPHANKEDLFTSATFSEEAVMSVGFVSGYEETWKAQSRSVWWTLHKVEVLQLKTQFPW